MKKLTTALLLLTSFFVAVAAPAADYTYTSVVDSTGALKQFDDLFPSINNSGAVVFHAIFPASGSQPAGEGIYVTDGSSYRGIAVTGGVYSNFFANPTINDKGLVAFEAQLSDNGEGVFVGDGKTMGNKTIATSASGRLYQFSLITRFSDYGLGLDGNGNAVFRANRQTTRSRALFAGNGSKEETQLYPTAGESGYLLDPSPAVNASGTVVFLVDAEIKKTQVGGGTPVTVATAAGESLYKSFRSISINNVGTVAFVADLKAGGSGVYTIDNNGVTKTILDTKQQPQFSSFRSLSINNKGVVAVSANLTSGGANIFVIGPDGGKTVLTSELLGSTISGFYADMSPRAFNDAGQYVFYYELANGRQGIAVATPSNGVQPKTLGNISTRLPVLTGDNALVGGFIVTGNQPKKIIIRAIGPSLQQVGIAGALENPVLQLFGKGGVSIAQNDDWQDSQAADIQATGVAPRNNLGSAILRTLEPGGYTAVLRGKNGGTGIAVVEAYDLNQTSGSTLANISTRGFVGSGDNALFAGFIVGPYTKTVVRAIGPSLENAGIANPLADPTLKVVNAQGVIVAANNNWKETQQAEIKTIGLQPQNERESTLITTLQSGSYTAIVRGVNNGTGTGVVEVYNLR